MGQDLWKVNLDRELEAMIGDTGTCVPGLGVIAYRDGREVYSRFLGRRRIGKRTEDDLPMERDSRFRVASVSKMFTVFTIMQLVEAGRLELDSDVGELLGFNLRNPNYPDIPITVRMLASHTSSIRDGRVYSIPPEKGLVEFFSPSGEYWEEGAHFAPEGQAPVEFFEYCNLNYGLLGTIIEVVTGERFDLYQKSHILAELDIHGDYVPGNFSPEEFEKLGTVYRKRDASGRWDENGPWHGAADDYRGIRPLEDTVMLQNPYKEDAQDTCSLKDYESGRNATIFSPTGGLRISCEELAHALEMLMNEGNFRGRRILSPVSVKQMMGREWIYSSESRNGCTCGGAILSYGLGMYQIDGGSSARLCRDFEVDLVGHTGEAFGLFSMLCLRPGTKDGFLYVMNGEAVEEDVDLRSRGRFSGNYVWEENLADAVCRNLFSGED